MGGDQFILDQHQVGRRGALSLRLLQNLLGNLLADHCARPPFGVPRVPPTVSPSILIVGSPTPTGTPCPSFPQVPTYSPCLTDPMISSGADVPASMKVLVILGIG